ncbi:MAG TPA: ATP-binding protein [Candidatus Sulfotelmatobacter sp.]|nr:ATP-binding protein [Candidatus Sulfotelmatobacter sp.]
MPLPRVISPSASTAVADDAGRLRRSNRRVAHAVLAFTVAVTLGALIGVWFELADHRQDAIEHAARDSGSLARVIDEDMTRAVQVVDLSLQGVVERRRRELIGPQGPGGSLSDTYLAGKVAQVPYIAALIAVDEHGTIIAGTDPSLDDIDFGREPFFRFHRDDSHGADLRIGAPRRYGASWLATLSRAFVKPDGSFGGAVVALIDPEYFEQDFRNIDIGKNGSVALFLRDGTLFAHWPHIPFERGSAMREQLSFPRYLARAERGIFEQASIFDHITRVFSYRAIQGLPLVVVAGVAEDAIFADWWRSLQIYGALVLALVGVAGSLCYLVLRELRRGEDLTGKLASSEAAFRDKSTILEATLEHMDQGIYLVTGEGNLIAHNRRYEELFGFAFDNATPIPIERFVAMLRENGLIHTDADAAELAEYYQRAAAGEFLAWERPHGHGNTVELRANPVPGGGFVVTATDITERKRSEGALRHLVEEAQEASRAKSNFLANMSHELRTPLNAIIGFSEVISTEMFGPVSNSRYMEYANFINESGNHLLRLINDILDLSKAESGKLDLNDENLDIAGVVQHSILFITQQAAAGGITVATRLPADLPRLQADAMKLQQMLINLLSNAVKFSLPGSEVLLSAAVEPDGMLALAVSDSGIGIAKADIPKVLEPFRQVDSALSRKFQGTGLGLSLTKRLIELHGGTLAIESELGKGTTVTIRFPARRVLCVAVLPEMKLNAVG